MTQSNNNLTIGNVPVGSGSGAALIAAIQASAAAQIVAINAASAAEIVALNANSASEIVAAEAAEASAKVSAGALAGAALGEYGYSNLRDDFTATISSTTEIDLTSLPAGLTVDETRIVAVGLRPNAAADDYDWVYLRGSGDLVVSYAAGTITFSSAVLTVADHEAAVWIEGVGKYDVTGIDATKRLQTRDEALTTDTRSERVEEIDPIDARGQADTLYDVTNIVDGTYYVYVSMDTYRKGFFQLELNGGSGTVTISIQGTCQDEGVAAASRTYQDIGSATFGSASWTADAILADNAEKLAGYTYLRITIVASTGAADDADATIYGVRLY